MNRQPAALNERLRRELINAFEKEIDKNVVFQMVKTYGVELTRQLLRTQNRRFDHPFSLVCNLMCYLSIYICF